MSEERKQDLLGKINQMIQIWSAAAEQHKDRMAYFTGAAEGASEILKLFEAGVSQEEKPSDVEGEAP